MTRVFLTIILTVTICAISTAQSGAIQSVEELKASAFDKMFAYFEQMEKLRENYTAACAEKSWQVNVNHETPDEVDVLSIYYADSKGKVDYVAIGGKRFGSRFPVYWRECVRRDGDIYKRSGHRDAGLLRGVINKIDEDSKDPNGNRIHVNMINDAMTFPVVHGGYIDGGFATLGFLGHFYLGQMEVFHAERLKNGNLLGCFGGRKKPTVHVVEFSERCNNMPIGVKIIIDEDENVEYSDMLKKGNLYALTESTWVQTGKFWVPSTVNMKFFGYGSKRLDLRERQFEFVWKVGDNSPSKSLTADSEDWMVPFFGSVINEDYTLLKCKPEVK